MKSVTLSLLIGLLLVSVSSFTSVDDKLPIVHVTGGRISGTRNQTGDIHIFRGIPFAAPPVGDLRWKAPQPVMPWSGVRACTAFGPSPMQGKPAAFSMWSEEFLIPKEPISEDCLYLNVWTAAELAKGKNRRAVNRRPANRRAAKPVLVWIYGGGFNSGGSAVPIYDGEAMAKKGIVFVSINYRVGAFGFFAHPELSRESGKQASGNYGIMDQIAALQWVKQNIAAFGGDPANVTIAGQSAGSMSVNCLVASPLAKGLFTKAIAESGANFARPNPTLQQAEESGQKMMRVLGASSLAELRAKPADEIFQKLKENRGLIVDGYVLPETIASIYNTGKQNNVALLTGWNQQEGLLFGPIKKADEYRKQIEQQYGADAPNFLKHYPANTDAEAETAQQNASRDLIFGVQNYIWANKQSQQGKPVYLYRFTRKVPATGEYVKYGAFHTGEVPYAYDNLKFVNRPWEPVDHDLARIMSSYWANFVKTGNPNGNGLPQWPAYSQQGQQTMMLGTTPKAEPLPDAATLAYLANYLTKAQ